MMSMVSEFFILIIVLYCRYQGKKWKSISKIIYKLLRINKTDNRIVYGRNNIKFWLIYEFNFKRCNFKIKEWWKCVYGLSSFKRRLNRIHFIRKIINIVNIVRILRTKIRRTWFSIRFLILFHFKYNLIN